MLPLDSVTVAIAFLADVFLGLLTFYKNPKSATNRYFLFLSLSLGLYLITNSLPLHQNSEALSFFWIKFIMSLAAVINLSFLFLATTFPRNSTQGPKWMPAVASLVTIVVIIFVQMGLIFSGLASGTTQPVPGPLIVIFLLQTIIFLGAGLVVLLRKLRHSTGTEREQLRFFFLGTLLMFLGILATNFIPIVLFRFTALVGLLPLHTLFFTGLTSYAIIRHRLLDIRLVVAKSVTYALIVLILGYFFAGGLFLFGTFISSRPYSLADLTISTILALVMAYTFQPLSKFLEAITNKIFFKENYSAPVVLGDISKILAINIDLETIVNDVFTKITAVLHLEFGVLVLYKEEKFDRFVGKNIPEKLKNASVDEIALMTPSVSAITLFDDLEESPLKDLMRSLNIGAIMKLTVKEKMVGIVVLGNKLSGDIYSLNDTRVLTVLNPELSIAIQNAQQYEEIKAFSQKLQIEVQKATHDLQIANDKLQELDKKKDEFVSLASHELRTPMTAIRSYLWLALAGKGGPLSEKQSYYLQRSYNSTVRLIQLVNDMLNVSRIESGKITLNVQKVDLGKFTDEVVGEVKPRADELGIGLENQYDISRPLPPVLADPDKIKEVMINFIGNSLKFSPKGSAITISFDIKDNMVNIHVCDKGEGIAPEDMDKLFQKFSLIKESYVTNQKAAQGTGLGLYISKSIVELHGGKIWAESPGHGQGATFSFSLKIYNDEDFNRIQQSNSGKEGLGIIPNVV